MLVFTLKKNYWFGKKGQKFIKLRNDRHNTEMCWLKKGGGLKTKPENIAYTEICAYNEWGNIS